MNAQWKKRLKQMLGAGLCMLLALSASAQDKTDNFLKRHWTFPMLSQGVAPKSYSAVEASLHPDSCASCHPKQYEGWRNSRHARAMGQGLMGQLLDIKPNAVGELRDCTRCHAPLAEQEASLSNQLRGNTTKRALHKQGLVCAACHVRRHVRYGPPSTRPATDKKLPHDGFVSTPAFEDSRFCTTCHQFGEDGYALNGKPLENTYAEWQASPYAKQGVQCQSCHMPQRQHLWRGIHDTEMTAQGVTITHAAPVQQNGRITAQLAMRNSGTGHFFPTYVTPRIVVQIYQETDGQQLIEGTLQEKIIARQVSADLSEELSDTRLAPGEKMTLNYKVARHSTAKAVVMRVRVEPDYFYTGLYRYLINNQAVNKGMTPIQVALKNSLDSAYDLYQMRFPLNRR